MFSLKPKDVEFWDREAERARAVRTYDLVTALALPHLSKGEQKKVLYRLEKQINDGVPKAPVDRSTQEAKWAANRALARGMFGARKTKN